MCTVKLCGILTVKNAWAIPVFCVTEHVHCIVTRGVTWTWTLRGTRQMNYAKLQVLSVFCLRLYTVLSECDVSRQMVR